ncbi:PIN domain-containing protein [Candidatus Woesearchaeota archaeon]|nr:PIN domain-containing protein [Candidatus Woesearchaeota archaeon]
MKIVFDTFAWMEYFLGSEKGKKVGKYLNDEVITPTIVLLELSYRADAKGWNLMEHLNFIKLNSAIYPIDEDFILAFGKLYNETKRKVPTIGIVDIIVLMTAIKEKAMVLTGDTHFKNMPKVIFLE